MKTVARTTEQQLGHPGLHFATDVVVEVLREFILHWFRVLAFPDILASCS